VSRLDCSDSCTCASNVPCSQYSITKSTGMLRGAVTWVREYQKVRPPPHHITPHEHQNYLGTRLSPTPEKLAATPAGATRRN
jgi:hypothetical protein